MLIIGITGGLGTGKSTVAAELRKKGCVIIDADSLAKKARKKGTTTYEKILREFGPDVLRPDKSIDRKKLAQKAFSSKSRIGKLCSIIHPYVCFEIRRKIKKLKMKNFKKPVVIDAPLLIEAGLEKDLDILVVVRSSISSQVARSAKRLGITRDRARRRIKAQMPLSKKEKKADFIINNNKTKAQLRSQVKKLWNKLKEETGGKR